MYNKRKYLKANDKKVLHKVKKQWVTISLALLMAIGGGVIAGHTVHADVVSNNFNNPNINISQTNKNTTGTNDVMNKSNSLHHQLMLNASTNTSNVKSSVNNDNNSATTNSNKSNRNNVDLTSPSAQYQYGTYKGLNYKYNPDVNNVEFTDGTANNNLDWFIGTAPNNVKNAAHIKFDDDINLNNVTSMDGMFWNAPNLKTLDLGNNFHADNVTNMGVMFSSDRNLQYLNLGNNFTNKNSTNTNMNMMFSNDPKLQTLNLGNNFDANHATNMNWMFNGDSSLKSLNLPISFTAKNVTNMKRMFNDDFNLQHIYGLNHLNTSNVNNMANMFGSDSSLQSLDVSSFNTQNVRNFTYMFGACTNISDLTLPNTFNTSNANNMQQMFFGMANLENLNLGPSFYTNNVTNMSGMLSNLHVILHINLGTHFNTSNVSNMNGMFENDYCLRNLDLSNFDTHNVSDMRQMFETNSAQSIILGSSFNTQKALSSNFNGQNGLSDMFAQGLGTTNTPNASLHFITIQSPNTVFNANAELPVMYQRMPDGSYSNAPANLNNSTNGTFASTDVVNPIKNPNQKGAQEEPYLVSDTWVQNYHYTSPMGHANDIESIIPHYNNGKIDYWDVYHLTDPYNIGPAGQWYHVTTNDFSKFTPFDSSDPLSINNVAVPDPKYSLSDQDYIEVSPSDKSAFIPWRQVAGGSIVSNKKSNGGQWITSDTYGNKVSSDARLAYFANYAPNNDGSYLAYANPNGNGGYTQFKPYGEHTIFNGNLVNVGMTGSFRDPYVSVNPTNPNQLVAYCAGGNSETQYILTSSDAIHWHYTSKVNVRFVCNHVIGSDINVETPYVTKLNNTPIMFFSAQDMNGDGKEVIAYVTGQFNNGLFQTTPNSKYGTIDHGFDIYAGNFTPIDNNHLAFVGWLDDWTYFTGSHIGNFSLPRVLSWNGNNIETTPIEPSNSNQSDKVTSSTNQYQPNGKVNVVFNTPTNTFDIKLSRPNMTNNYVEYSLNNNILTMTRNGSTHGATNRTKSVDIGTNQVSNIQFYLDNESIEAYIPEIHKMFSILDFDNTHNTPYVITSNVPAKINSYKFKLGEAPSVENINNIISELSADKAELNRDWNTIKGQVNNSANESKGLLDEYFNNIQQNINNANNVHEYNDARQHMSTALVNDNINMAKAKLYQADIQLKNLDGIAANISDNSIANYYRNSVATSVAQANQKAANNAAHAADENIINQQKASVANSVNASNQQKANQAAQQADQRIAQQQRTSVANSVAAANKAKANHAAQIADQNILNQQKESVANSVNAANQRTATSAANSADKSIESSIANSYAKSADTSIANSYKNSSSASVSAANSSYAKTAAGKAAAKFGASSADKSIESSIASSYAKSADNSIANSYKNSVNNSVEAANQSKANSAANSADTSLANSAAKSADNSIESSIANSYANSANNSLANSVKNSINNSVNAANQSKATSAAKSADKSIESSEEAKNTQNLTPASQSTPVTPINPAPFVPIFNPITPSSEASVSNSSVASSTVMPTNGSTPESSASHQVTGPVTHHSNTHKIALVGVNKRAYFTSKHYEAKFTTKMRKHATVLEATVKSNHNVAYKVQVGKHIGYVYGYLTKFIKPSFFMYKNHAYIHFGKKAIRVYTKNFKFIRINKSIQYNNRKYIRYDVTYGRKHGVMYDKLPVVKKISHSKYYQLMPKHYHYAKVIKPLCIYSSKYFSKRNRRGVISKGITVKIKRIVKADKTTRFELTNGKFITGLRSFTKLV